MIKHSGYAVFLHFFFLLLSSLAAAAQTVDTLSLYFDLDNSFLNSRTEKKLDKIIKRYGSGSSFILIGYTDYQGDTYYNDMLAMRRAQNSAAYLEKSGVAKSSIKMVLGKGEIKRTTERPGGYAEDRKVDIIIRSAVVTNTPEPPAKPNPTPIESALPKPVEIKKDTTTKTVSKESIKESAIGQSLKIENLYFVGGRDIIKMESEKALDELYKILKEDTALIIRIEGHVCCTNRDDEDGMDLATGRFNLSYTRAKSVYDYLIYRGIDERRLSFVGMGHSMPATQDESTEEGADLNRRVEIRIINK